MPWPLLIEAALKIGILIFLVILPAVALSVYAERRVSAIIQDRVGPNRVGLPLTLFGAKKDWAFFGLFQPAADGLKFILKEDVTPGHVNRFYYWLAPVLVMVPALLTCAVLPFGSTLELPFVGRPIPMVIANLDVGILFVFAISSLGVYGIVLAGWSSNSKYPFLGGVRSSSQMISYEISLGLSVVPMLMIYGDLNLVRISEYQNTYGWALLPLSSNPLGFGWKGLLLWIPILISFVVFIVSLFAETNRLPFDLPECETELVAGYHTEYSSMKFALFFLGEYAAMLIGAGFAVTLFLGGWSLPFGLGLTGDQGLLAGLLNIATFFAKVALFLLFFIWVRWSLPRFRYDQLMRLGWVYFFEIALINIFLTAGILLWLR
ncbi:MAG TPA: complex I subunit 1 family protein [Verrucomicrobiales bacterium]|nr:complex I subunit 1 family protein [Verrucomicrobiales bacterium]